MNSGRRRSSSAGLAFHKMLAKANLAEKLLHIGEEQQTVQQGGRQKKKGYNA
jgi:hypothetical protein